MQDTHFSKGKEPFVRSLWGGECILNNKIFNQSAVGTLGSKVKHRRNMHNGQDKKKKFECQILHININFYIIKLSKKNKLCFSYVKQPCLYTDTFYLLNLFLKNWVGILPLIVFN